MHDGLNFIQMHTKMTRIEPHCGNFDYDRVETISNHFIQKFRLISSPQIRKACQTKPLTSASI